METLQKNKLLENILRLSQPLALESNVQLPEVEIAYTTLGTLNARKDNVVWVCHALTANSNPLEWWPGLVGEGNFINPEKHFIVCANMLGSCYGTTGPDSINPENGAPYSRNFPLVTIRDMVALHRILFHHLGLTKIYLAIGGSMGGQQALEWAVSDPELIDNVCVVAANANHSPWGIAFNEAQRMALDSDPSPDKRHGIEAARAIAMLSYRNYLTYELTQSETVEKIDDFRASSYQRYQGEKLRKRFNPDSYYVLSKAMDSHHLGRNRGGIIRALGKIKANLLAIGIDTDVLFPSSEQRFIAENMANGTFKEISSNYGHDGFLIETDQVTRILKSFLKEN